MSKPFSEDMPGDRKSSEGGLSNPTRILPAVSSKLSSVEDKAEKNESSCDDSEPSERGDSSGVDSVLELLVMERLRATDTIMGEMIEMKTPGSVGHSN